jgi:putative drug exporter of the RND superfamily
MRHGQSQFLGRLADFVGRHGYLVLGMWIVVAAGLNLVAPRLEQVGIQKSGPVIPDSAPSLVTIKNMGIQFGESQASAIGYLVLEDDRGFNNADHTYYHEIITKLRSDKSQIDSVQDLLSDPATAPSAASEDGKAVYAVVQFYGGVGSATQREGQSFVRALIDRTPKPPGLAVYQTGPAPTIGDEIAAEDHSVTVITAMSAGMIIVLLLCVYRRFSTILVALASVGLALAVSRPIVALLGMHAGLDVSVFSAMLLAAIVLGAGTDYAVFLISGYHQGRRQGKSSHDSIVTSATQISGIIVASGLTVAASCAVMAATQIILFRTTGVPCSIGVIVAVLAALTLVPALLSILGRRGFVEPRDAATSRYWRRVGVRIVRRPAWVLTASLAILFALAAQTYWMSTGYDERAMQPATTPSNQGYDAITRHYETSELTPDILLIEADRDLRNSADFAALNSVVRSVQKVPGVSEVRGPTQPQGKPIPEFTLSGQDRVLAEKLTLAIQGLSDSQPKLAELDEGVQRLTNGLGQLSSGNALAAKGSGRIQNGMEQLRSGLVTALNGTNEVSGGTDRLADGSQELADVIDSVVTPILTQLDVFAPPPASDLPCDQGSNCAEGDQMAILAQDTSLIGRVRYFLTQLKVGSRQLADGNHSLSGGAHQLQTGLAAASDGTIQLTDGQKLLTTKLGELSAGAAAARSGIAQISDGINQISPQMRNFSDGLSQARNFLNEVSANVSGGPDAGFYVPKGAFQDPRLMQAMKYFISKDGHTARLLVFGDTTAYDENAIGRLDAVIASTNAALAETTLKGSRVEAGGLAAGFRDLHHMVVEDFAIIATFTLLFIFVILAWLLGGLIAPLYLIITIAISYLSALGLSVLIWQGLLGMAVYWSVPPVSFVALVAVGSDYNLLFMSRIRANSTLGIRSGIVKAFTATGGVITTAGVIFALTMLAMLASPVYTIAQIGFTIGAGLLIDTFIVRTLTVPAVAALLGARIWWPSGLFRLEKAKTLTSSPGSSTTAGPTEREYDPGDSPEVLARTTKSLVVVCQAGPRNFYYRGVRLSDGASIELDGAVRSSGGFDVTDPADGTRYQVRPNQLNIIQPDGQVDSESMVQYRVQLRPRRW